jgi:hypothetical protein
MHSLGLPVLPSAPSLRVHGGKRIHALRARGARHQFHRERRDARSGHLLNDFGRTERAQEPNQQLIAAQQRKVSLASHVIRTVAKHLHNNVSRAEDGGTIGSNLSALLYVNRVGIAGPLASARLDNHFESGLRECGDDAGNERNPALSRIAFLRNSNNHAVILSPGRIVTRGTL